MDIVHAIGESPDRIANSSILTDWPIENVAKGGGDKPTADVVIAKSGEVCSSLHLRGDCTN